MCINIKSQILPCLSADVSFDIMARTIGIVNIPKELAAAAVTAKDNIK